MTNLIAATANLKTNDNAHAVKSADRSVSIEDETKERVILPLPPLDLKDKVDMEIYARFMRHLRYVPNSRMEVKVLSAIQFAADMMDLPDSQVARCLLDLGLHAPRISFPVEFLEFADNARTRCILDFGSAGQAMQDLYDHWDNIGEDKFVSAKRDYKLIDEAVITNAL